MYFRPKTDAVLHIDPYLSFQKVGMVGRSTWSVVDNHLHHHVEGSGSFRAYKKESFCLPDPPAFVHPAHKYYKVQLQYHSVLQSTTPVLLCTTKYYSSTTPYYKVLIQYYSVLQSTTPVLQKTTPVLFCTTKYCSSTTPVLVCTTKYYSSTTPCTTKFSFARRGAPTSPNAVPATQSDSHDWSSSHMKRHLQCAKQQDSSSNHQIRHLPRKMTLMSDVRHIWNVIYNARSNWQQVSYTKITKCCACHEKWLASLILVTYEMSFALRGATALTLQRLQILRLPRKMTLMIDARHIWDVICNARSNRTHPPTSPNSAPAT